MSFYDLIAHFFLALNNIPLSGCATVCLSTPLLKDTFVSSKFWQVRKRPLQISVCKFLCGRKFSFHLGKYQGACLLIWEMSGTQLNWAEERPEPLGVKSAS